MKTKLLMFAVAAAMTVFTACTNEKIVYVEKENPLSGIELEPGEGIVKISMANTLSRAARPITDNAAKNSVDRILFKFVINTDGGTEYDDFNVVGIVNENVTTVESIKTSEVLETNNHILDISGTSNSGDIYVKFSGLKQGVYRIYAFGYNSEMNSGNIPFSLTFSSDKNTYECTLISPNTEIDELFAGSTGNSYGAFGAEVNQHGLFNIDTNGEIEIELKRQVAALMAYMSNVPTYVNHEETGVPTKVTKITISSPKKMSGLYAPGNLITDWAEKRFNGIDDSEFTDGDLNHLLTFNLESTDQGVTITEGTDPGDPYTFKKSQDPTYLLAEECKNTTFSFEEDSSPEENTLFGSRFIFAYDAAIYTSTSIKYATLNICYWNNNELIRSVGLKGYDKLSGKPSDLTSTFQLRCNNFYAVGHLKTWDSDGDGDIEDETGPQEDKPLDIDEAAGKEYVPISIVDEFDDSLDLSNGKEDTQGE